MEDNKMEDNKCQVLSLVSGKGGSGKTSTSISIAYLLHDIGLNVLLVDFDLNTNGCSYFFKYDFQRENISNGLYDLLSDLQLNGQEEYDKKKLNEFFVSSMLPVKKKLESYIKINLDFIPARVNFRKKIDLYESTTQNVECLKFIVSSIINSFGSHYDIIIFDNQAGSNLAASISSKMSDKVVIISEFDPISSDAVDTLISQIGENFSGHQRHLINKLYINESNQYKDFNILFQSFNRLPPLPFDFGVRAAFSSREVPINVENPTPFLIAIFNTTKALFPEYRDEFLKYQAKIDSAYKIYQDKLDQLLKKKTAIQKMTLARKPDRFFVFMLSQSIAIILLLVIIYGADILNFLEKYMALVIPAFTLLIGYSISIGFNYRAKKREEKEKKR